jgi:hypothetical protein
MRFPRTLLTSARPEERALQAAGAQPRGHSISGRKFVQLGLWRPFAVALRQTGMDYKQVCRRTGGEGAERRATAGITSTHSGRTEEEAIVEAGSCDSGCPVN